MHVVAVYCDKNYETHIYTPRNVQHRVKDECIFPGSLYYLSE